MTVKNVARKPTDQPSVAISGIKDGEVYLVNALTVAIQQAGNPPPNISYENGITVNPVEQPATNA